MLLHRYKSVSIDIKIIIDYSKYRIANYFAIIRSCEEADNRVSY